MTDKKSFVLYCDQVGVFEALSDKECKELILAVFNFYKVPDPKLSPLVNIAFLPIKNNLNRDLQEWRKTCEMRRQFGKRGGLAKASKSYQKLPKASLRQFCLASVADTVTVTDTEILNNKNLSKEGLPDGLKVLEGLR